jgi:hypothetical protein
MATFTTNYNLSKIELAENSLNAIFTEGNQNLDLIDELLKTQENNLNNYVNTSEQLYTEIEVTENQRQINEGIRGTNEVLRGTNENNRIQQYNKSVIATNKAEDISVWEEFNPLHPYLPLNKVSYNGDSYINIIACTGIYPINTTNFLPIAKHGSNGFSSIIESKFTVTVDNTTNLIHGIVGFDLSKDILVVIDNYNGGELEKGIEYTENVNLLSVDLIGWSAKVGESFNFKLFKNLNEATIQTIIDNSIIAKTNLDGSISSGNTTKTALQNVIDTANLTTYASKGSVDSLVVSVATKQNKPTTTNTAIGIDALKNSIADKNNTANGFQALYANTSGYGNTADGMNSLKANTEGVNNTATGEYALSNETTGSFNTAIGYCALLLKQDGTNNAISNNCTGIGVNTKISGDNQVQLGDNSTTTYCYGAIQNRSDIRDKTDIQDTILGLDFIKALRPVEFKWDYREDYIQEVEKEDGTIEVIKLLKDGSKKRTRLHQGFIAQEVKQIMDTQNIDFAGFQDHSINGGCDVLSLGYSEFISPMVKAIQEQQKMIEELKKEIELLKLK